MKELQTTTRYSPPVQVSGTPWDVHSTAACRAPSRGASHSHACVAIGSVVQVSRAAGLAAVVAQEQPWI
eukprot:695362-Pelagomonas_calceolata.AAC.1